MSVYRGRRYDPVPAGQTQGSSVVFELLEAAGLLNKGFHLITDSFFSSIDLARRLFQVGTNFTGTLRANSRDQPNAIRTPHANAGQCVYMRKRNILLCAYKERPNRKAVRLVTNCMAARNGVRKPEIVEFYNKNMGGVDLNDMLTLTYDDNRKTLKLWKKIVYNVLHRVLLNVFICYTQNTDPNQKLSRAAFI
ncbi:hypothetical protein CI610_03723 [invertebrate metagenome]|uniref:PiggyBac transposable element-derived protein domain-containing protein n=1 Tax=invertebrate metagenome TaxID=1711999 RepID=A0A2H9T2B7_9ZZZZ